MRSIIDITTSKADDLKYNVVILEVRVNDDNTLADKINSTAFVISKTNKDIKLVDAILSNIIYKHDLINTEFVLDYFVNHGVVYSFNGVAVDYNNVLNIVYDSGRYIINTAERGVLVNV